jgi:hypothetical protein
VIVNFVVAAALSLVLRPRARDETSPGDYTDSGPALAAPAFGEVTL